LDRTYAVRYLLAGKAVAQEVGRAGLPGFARASREKSGSQRTLCWRKGIRTPGPRQSPMQSGTRPAVP